MYGPACASWMFTRSQEVHLRQGKRHQHAAAPSDSESGTGFQVEAVSLPLKHKVPGPSAVLPGSVIHLNAWTKNMYFPS